MAVTGSSPRMRGARARRYRFRSDRGIIPAYAGSTVLGRKRALLWRDHPRVCGEHDASTETSRLRSGSSPRMRGAPWRSSTRPSSRWIIPAYAGSTRRTAPRIRQAWDHPRVCGEHQVLSASEVRRLGSSPRMRGALPQQTGAMWPVGIIPAYAGSTSASKAQLKTAGDHPRVCGEHTRTVTPSSSGWGSSPRMRGAHFEIPDIPMTWYMTGEFFIRFRRAWNCPPTQQGSSNTGLYGVGRPPR